MVDRGFTAKYLGEILSRTRRAVKVAIMDQTKMGGVGNIYASDALWKAEIDPRRPANELKETEIKRLHSTIKMVINKGIKHGGATASDDKFVNSSGLGGTYQNHFLTYEQTGKKCQRRSCKGKIEKIKLGGRGTYFCPVCQK